VALDAAVAQLGGIGHILVGIFTALAAIIHND
jgi:hypothetical protein